MKIAIGRSIVAGLVLLSVTWQAGCSSRPEAKSPPSPAPAEPTTFGGVRRACRLLRDFATAGSPDCLSFPDGSELDSGQMLAYEESRRFTYAALGWPSGRVRRIIHLKPATYVVDDQFDSASSIPQACWQLVTSREPTITDRRVSLSASLGELEIETLLPEKSTLAAERTSGGTFQVTEQAGHSAAGPGVRFVHLLHVRDASQEATPTARVEQAGDSLKLTIKMARIEAQLELPGGQLTPGHIALTEPSGADVLPERLLPSSVLPYGAEGEALLARWDSEYRDGHKPAWESGRVCSELKRVLPEIPVHSGKALELGCGTGLNAIYLAEQGFDVTAVDISPTALRLAEERARQSGVKVRWLLADVTALPDVGTFDLLFDRGCYHGVRQQNLAGYMAAIQRCSHAGTQLFLMAGNANEKSPYGPPRVSEADLRRDFGGLFDFEWLRETHFDTAEPGGQGPLAWSALLRRKETPDRAPGS